MLIVGAVHDLWCEACGDDALAFGREAVVLVLAHVAQCFIRWRHDNTVQMAMVAAAKVTNAIAAKASCRRFMPTPCAVPRGSKAVPCAGRIACRRDSHGRRRPHPARP